MTPRYNVFVLFLANRISARRLRDLLSLCDGVLEAGAYKCRGYLHDKRLRHVGPKQCAYNAGAVEKWDAAFTKGRFVSFEVFDKWTDQEAPSNYVGIVADKDGDTAGVLTVALDAKLNSVATLERLAFEVSGSTQVLYGVLESEREWDEQVGKTTLRGRMIDILWKSIQGDNFQPSEGKRYDNAGWISCVYLGNFLTSRHLALKPDALRGSKDVAVFQPLGDSLCYLRFKSDPRRNARLQKRLRQHFHTVPSTGARMKSLRG